MVFPAPSGKTDAPTLVVYSSLDEPLAMPMIAGPGSIASVMLLMSRNSGLERSLVVLGAMVTILLLTLAALLAAGPIMRILGAKIEAVITRLLGVLLAALAVQFVLDGVSAVMR